MSLIGGCDGSWHSSKSQRDGIIVKGIGGKRWDRSGQVANVNAVISQCPTVPVLTLNFTPGFLHLDEGPDLEM